MTRFLGWLSVALITVSCAHPAANHEPSASAATASAAPSAPSTACALPSAPVTSRASDKNVEGAPLAVCSNAPLTGFFRDGRCSTGDDDRGVHVICSQVTDAFLKFSKAQGNDLVTPRDGFAGLKDGDRWCLCASRWAEAERAGVAPPVVVAATHEAAKTIVDAQTLRAHALVGP